MVKVRGILASFRSISTEVWDRTVRVVRILRAFWTTMAIVLVLLAIQSIVTGEIQRGSLLFLVAVIGVAGQFRHYYAYRLGYELGWRAGFQRVSYRDPGHIDDVVKQDLPGFEKLSLERLVLRRRNGKDG